MDDHTHEPKRPLDRLMDFILEIDKAKSVFRRTYLVDGTRLENDAEHGWHIAVMAMLLEPYASGQVDISRVIRMLLVHDLVEIDAGDTYAYDAEGNRDKLEREIAAAERIFAILPESDEDEFRALWDEFEACQSDDAKFAGAMDKLQPLLLNYHSGGKSWMEHHIRRSQVIERLRAIGDGSPTLWDYALSLIEKGVEHGWLIDE
jgi:putative hydrolases of HD superfamily